MSLLGRGGMGEVYRARDTRLDRTVAIKILPEAIAADPHFRERFNREARTISSLEDPHICALYDVGEHDGTAFLVMQYLDGETLASRIARGALPIGEALTIAIQIAGALDRAHRAGIVHRDLKPGNIMLTKAGAKLLDFGLAKSTSPLTAQAVSMVPTTPAELTVQGTILGTFQYMAPEQLEGQEADARTDIFAFGAVVYEMVTGRKAFEGKTQASLIGAIMHAQPRPMTSDQPLAPPLLERVVMKCLAKDPDERWQTASDLRSELRWSADAAEQSAIAAPAAIGRTTSERAAWIVAGVSLAALVVTAVALIRIGSGDRSAMDARTYHASIVLPDGMRFSPTATPASRFALSPDGLRIAIVATGAEGRAQLWIRPLDGAVAQPLAGTDGAAFPFWSPDSRFVAFVAQGKLKKIDASSGSPLTVADTSFSAAGAWNAGDVILFTPKGGSPIYRVPASGGTPAQVTTLDLSVGDTQHWFPTFLPDGQHFLYFAVGSIAGGASDPRAVYVGSLDAREKPKLLLQGGSNAKYAQGRVIFLRGSTLMSQAFDVGRLELRGEPVPIAEQVQLSTDRGVAGAFSVSQTGVLAYQSSSGVVRSQLAWFDRAGKQIAVLGGPADQVDVSLSPDGGRAAVSLLDPARKVRDLWLYDVARGVPTRFTFESADRYAPSWSPDGRRIAFSALRNASVDIYQKPSNGAGGEEELLAGGLGKFQGSWSPDGRFIVYVAGGGTIARSDLFILPLFGDQKPYAFLETRFLETHGQFSPDGRWISYTSSETEQREVYVAPFPGPGPKVRISAAGGGWARWRREGKEMFYVAADNTLTSVTVNPTASTINLGASQPMFRLRPRPMVRLDAYEYDVSPDGRRFLVNTLVDDATPPAVTLVVNWTAGLKK